MTSCNLSRSLHIQLNNCSLSDKTRFNLVVIDLCLFREQIEKEEDEDVYDVHTVSLFKQPNKGLGLSIIARRFLIRRFFL